MSYISIIMNTPELVFLKTVIQEVKCFVYNYISVYVYMHVFEISY